MLPEALSRVSALSLTSACPVTRRSLSSALEQHVAHVLVQDHQPLDPAVQGGPGYHPADRWRSAWRKAAPP